MKIVSPPVNTADATIIEADILASKIAYGPNGRVVGTWNNNFSVPTSPYELDNNTVILIHGGTTAQSAFATSPFST